MTNEELLKSIEGLFDKKLQDNLEPIRQELRINSAAIMKLEDTVGGIFDLHTVVVDTNQRVKTIQADVDAIKNQVSRHELAIKKSFH